MSGLIDWVRGILSLLFFVTLVQLILPDDNLRKYVRLVTGLVLLAALVQPLAGLLGDPARWEALLEGLIPFGEQGPGAAGAIADGARLREEWLEEVLGHALEGEKRRIEGYLSLVDGVDASRVDHLALAADGSVAALRLVVAGDAARSRAKVMEVLTKVLGIPERAISISWEEREGE